MKIWKNLKPIALAQIWIRLEGNANPKQSFTIQVCDCCEEGVELRGGLLEVLVL